MSVTQDGLRFPQPIPVEPDLKLTNSMGFFNLTSVFLIQSTELTAALVPPCTEHTNVFSQFSIQ